MLKPSAKVGVCPVCEQSVPLEPVPGRRWGMPSVVAEHAVTGDGRCLGQGRKTLSRSRAWGWPRWEHMSLCDRRVALMHVMECSNPVTADVRVDHPGVRYQGRVLRELPSHLGCVHAWDQTGGWEQALSRWGVDQVRWWVREEVGVEARQVLARYGWGSDCEPFVEGGQVVGVLAGPGAVRPKGWVWRHTPPAPSVAVPDRRTARGRAIVHHLMVVEADPGVRVGWEESDQRLGGLLRGALVTHRPVEVQAGSGQWVKLLPMWEQGAWRSAHVDS